MARVMIVDDNQPLLQYIEKELEKNGHEVLVAWNGQVGLERLTATDEKSIPQIIFCDYNMPGMTGYQFCLKVKGDDLFKNIPIVGIGDFPEREQHVLVSRLVKPFDYLSIEARIDRHCGYSGNSSAR